MTIVKRMVLAGCLAFLVACGCTPSSSGAPPGASLAAEPSRPSGGACDECPDMQLFCSATSCVCDANGNRFPRGECPAPGAADPAPPAGCNPADWFCNISGDCRCAS